MMWKAGRIEVAVHTDEIGARQQFLQADHIHLVGGGHLLRDAHDVVAQQGHAEGAPFAQHLAADVANADHAQHAFAQRAPGQFLPLAGFDRVVHPGLAARESQHVGHHAVGDRHGESVGGAADLDAQLSGRFLIDGVNTGAPLGDDLQARAALPDDLGRVTVVAA